MVKVGPWQPLGGFFVEVKSPGNGSKPLHRNRSSFASHPLNGYQAACAARIDKRYMLIVKILGMPLAIVACFATGLVTSLLPKAPAPLAAFFLAVGLTCLTYSYLGGHLEKQNAGSGTIGLLSFKLGGSIVTFLVSWLFLNHHLALSGKAASEKLSLETAEESIRVEAGSRPVGQLDGKELQSWVEELAEVDYFHPALILARRPFCSDSPGKCILNAGFRAVASTNPKVAKGTMKLCVIGKSDRRDIKEILEDPTLQPLLANLEVISANENSSNDSSLTLKGSYAKGGGLAERCRNLSVPHSRDALPVIRIGALINPIDFEQLVAGRPNKTSHPYEVKILFQ